MIAYLNRQQQLLSYSDYIRDNERQQSLESPADRTEQNDEFVVGVLVSQGAITAEAESMKEYVSPDEAGDDSRRYRHRRRYHSRRRRARIAEPELVIGGRPWDDGHLAGD